MIEVLETAPSRRLIATALVALSLLTGCTHAVDAESAANETDQQTVPAAPEEVSEPVVEAPHGTDQTLRVGIRFHQPGLGLMADGDPTGFDVDVAAYVAYKLGYSPYDIEWVEVSPDNREELLSTGAVDMVVAAYSITAERAETVEFAGPYLLSGQDFLVRSEDGSINTANDLDGKTLCVVPQSTSEDLLAALFGESVRIVNKPVYADCVRAVVDGEADATSTDDIILAGLAASDEFFALVRLLGHPFSVERYGIGLPRGSNERCNAINAALAEMVGDGSWQKFIDRHTAGTGYSPEDYGNPPEIEPCV